MQTWLNANFNSIKVQLKPAYLLREKKVMSNFNSIKVQLKPYLQIPDTDHRTISIP